MDPTKKLVSITIKSNYNDHKVEKIQTRLMSCLQHKTYILTPHNNASLDPRFKRLMGNYAVLKLQDYNPTTNKMLAKLQSISCDDQATQIIN